MLELSGENSNHTILSLLTKSSRTDFGHSWEPWCSGWVLCSLSCHSDLPLNPGGPLSPGRPFSPGCPGNPASPRGPGWAPRTSPGRPLSPGGPTGPGGPLEPGNPSGPGRPMVPLDPWGPTNPETNHGHPLNYRSTLWHFKRGIRKRLETARVCKLSLW